MAVDFSQSYATGTFNLTTGAVNIAYLTGKPNDSGAGIYINLINNVGAIVNPTVETMILYATRPDGTKVYFVGENELDRIRIDFNSSIYEVVGNVSAEIQLIDSNGLKKTSNTFTINASEQVFDASYVKSTDDFRVLKEALDDVKYVESELQNITPEQINQVTTAEQGRVTAEQGRVIAEQGRVTAENNRVATLNAKADKTYVDAQLAEKVQNFKLKNEVVNGDFSQGTTGWAPSLSTNSVSGGKLINTGNGTQIYPYVTQTLPIPRVVGNKTYVRADMRTLDGCNSIAMQLKSGFNLAIKTSPITNELYKLSGVFIEDSNTGNTLLILQHVYSAPASNSLGKRLEIGNVLAINLTGIFGADNEPTKEEMDRLVEMVPNQWWDGELDLTQKQYVNWLLSFIREKANKVQEDWITPTLLNGWNAFSTGDAQPGYYKDNFDNVHLRGMVKGGTGTGLANKIMDLPVGYRPAKIMWIPVIGSGAHTILVVTSSGSVYVVSGSNISTYVSFGAELIFKAEA